MKLFFLIPDLRKTSVQYMVGTARFGVTTQSELRTNTSGNTSNTF